MGQAADKDLTADFTNIGASNVQKIQSECKRTGSLTSAVSPTELWILYKIFNCLKSKGHSNGIDKETF